MSLRFNSGVFKLILMKSISFFMLFILWMSGSGVFAQINQVKFIKTKINEKITVLLPEGFTVMPDAAYAKKYGAYRQPIAIYTSPDGAADFGINEQANRSLKAFNSSDWNEKDLQMMKGLYKSSIAEMHNEVKFLQDSVQTINKRKFIVLEFIGVVKDEEGNAIGNSTRELRHYNYLMYTVEGGKILVFNFNCPEKSKMMWSEAARGMMQSVKIAK